MSEPERPVGFVPGRHLIEAYGRGGFRFAGMSHRGSILILPSGIHAWPVQEARGMIPPDFNLVWREEPPVEFLLIGTGPTIVPFPDALRRPFREVGISVDAMATGAAARTYNVLLAEERRVAAALIAVG
jgi:uncharacterized protein